MELIQYIAIGFFAICLLFGDAILSEIPYIKRLRSVQEPLGEVKFSNKFILEKFTMKVICETPFIKDYYEIDDPSTIKYKDADIKFGDLFAIVSYYEKTLHHIVRELKIYSALTLFLIIGHFLYKLGSVETSHSALELLPFFEIIMFILFTVRLIVELSKINSIVK